MNPQLICRSGLWFVLLLVWASVATAAPDAKLWPRWQQHDANSTLTIDHGVWNSWLGRYVVSGSDGINRVAYRQVSQADREALESYIGGLQALKISDYNRAEQRAFWINLYNALTVDTILDHYPVESILKIRSGVFSAGPWGLDLARVEDESLTLDDIEHRILRPIWQGPLTHYAVNCASYGCPNLQSEAFTAANTGRLLETAARAYVNHPRGARVEEGRLRVSSIYDWFEDDFGGNDRGVIEHLKTYAGDALRNALDGIDRISDDDYDWNLNDVEPSP